MTEGGSGPSRAGQPGDDARFNILVVDDRPENLMAFEAILAPLGQVVVSVRSGEEALRELLSRRFAVILLDVNMPGIDGYETAALIRERPASQYTPIIFVTAGSPGDTHVVKGYSLGAVDYLFSPVDADIVRAKISVFLELARKGAIIQEQSEILRAAAERRADLVESRMQELLNGLDVGVYRASPQGALLDVNPAFLRLFQLSSRDDRAIERWKQFATGRPLRSLLSGHDASELKAPNDYELERADGRRVWISIRKSVSEAGDGKVIDGVVADISERKAHERLLRESNRALQRANEDLNQFAHATSHDLKEPLRMVAMYAGLIKKRDSGTLDKESLEFLGFIGDGVTRMDQLLNDLLTYVRVAQSSLEIAAQMIDADRALDQALANLKTALDESGGSVARDPLPSITMQEGHLVQLFQNLIGNAIKYRGKRPPRIKVGSEKIDGAWRFTVADNGIGIPREHQKQIFGVFKRLHGHDYPGTGIGLAICTKIVERYGGEIGVDSEVGRGSTFYFTAR